MNIRDTEMNKIIGLFNSMAGGKSLWEIFNDVITIISIVISNTIETSERKYEEKEKIYKQLINQYNPENIMHIFAETINVLETNPFQDLLGKLYMGLNMGSKEIGQFFTPYHLAKMMAEAVFDKTIVEKEIANKGYIIISEPACGAGANVIAFCEVMKKNGYNYQEKMVAICQELNRLTAQMCYIQLSLIGCAAVIKIGDTLAEPYTHYDEEVQKGSSILYTPMYVRNGVIV